MSKRIKKNDMVVVLAGNDRRKRGKVLSVDSSKDRITVEGVHIIKKAMPKSQDRPQGGFLEREAPIHISNVMLAEEYDQRRGAKKTQPAAA